jgi:hypothetical protein
MVKNLGYVGLALLLTACASQQPKYVTDKIQNRTQIESIKTIKIVYSDNENYGVVDAGGSGSTGLLGFLGPIGSIAGAVADITSAATLKSRAESRSKQFTDAVKTDFPNDANLNKQFVDKLAASIKSSGRSVELVSVKRPVGNLDLSKNMSNTEVSDGSSVLGLRITSGYGAVSQTARYQPVTVVEYYLKEKGKTLISNTITDREGEHRYATFDSLLSSRQEAFSQLKDELMPISNLVYRQIFDFSEVNK